MYGGFGLAHRFVPSRNPEMARVRTFYASKSSPKAPGQAKMTP